MATVLGDTLTCIRGGRTVFEGLSFQASSGDQLILTGQNGAGKSTLLRLIAGFLKPAAGTLAGDTSDFLYLGPKIPLRSSLTVCENLTFWTHLLEGVSELISPALQAWDLAHIAHAPAHVLSEGQRRRLFLCLLKTIPRSVWLLDEPTLGLDTQGEHHLCEMLAHHKGHGGILIFASHNRSLYTPTQELNLEQHRRRAA